MTTAAPGMRLGAAAMFISSYHDLCSGRPILTLPGATSTRRGRIINGRPTNAKTAN